MSNIPEARELLLVAARHLNKAIALMKREPPIKKAPIKRVVIDAAMRKRVRDLAARNVPHHEIANIVGLRNGGRVSEILNGKR